MTPARSPKRELEQHGEDGEADERQGDPEEHERPAPGQAPAAALLAAQANGPDLGATFGEHAAVAADRGPAAGAWSDRFRSAVRAAERSVVACALQLPGHEKILYHASARPLLVYDRGVLRRCWALFPFLVSGCGDGASLEGSGGAADGSFGTTSGGGTTGPGLGTGSGSTTGTGGSGDLGPTPGNAVVLDDGFVLALHPVEGGALPTRAIGFTRVADEVTARDERGLEIWSANLGGGSLFGGFDFDADGVPDLGLVRSEDTGAPCGEQTIVRTRIDVARGSNGELFPLTAELDALCWDFSGNVYPTAQWTDLDVLFGSGSSVIATAPYYATGGTFHQFDGTAFTEIGTFIYPSVAAYGATYPLAKPNPYGQSVAHIANSHVANGLFVAPNKLAFFTSARAVAYEAKPLSADQLLADVPWLSGGRTDLAGRNYGLVSRDPSAASKLVLVSGTGADTVYADMFSGAMAADPWGQIERHVAIVDLSAGTVDDRFFSYAHDNDDGNQYERRVVYPDSPFVRTASPARLAFNVYEGGRWRLHVTAPGTTEDATVLLDWFLWDIRDLDGDGVDEWVLSPAKDPSDPDVPGYYFVKWRTVIAHFDDDRLALEPSATHEGAIPYLVPFFRSPEKTTSRSFLYPALTERQPDGGLALLLRSSSGDLVRVATGRP